MAETTTATPRPAPLTADLDAGAQDSTIRLFTALLLSEDVRATFRSLH
jgi:hypothetical protein